MNQPPLADLLSQQRVLSAHIEKEARKLMEDKPTPVGTVDEELVGMPDALLGKMRARATIYRTSGRINYHDEDAAVDELSATLIEQLLNRVERADADEREAYEIGERDGYDRAVQDIDLLTGGDGEYRACLGPHNPDRNCPDATAMKARIAARFAALGAGVPA